MKTWWTDKAWPWFKKGGMALVGLLAILLGLRWLFRTKGRLGRVKDKLAIAEATKEIEKLQAVRDAVEERVGEKDEAIQSIDRQLVENKRRIIDAHEGGEELTDEEMLEEFDRLGI